MHIRQILLTFVAAASCMALALLWGQPGIAFADTITVTNVNDSGAGSLRGAITLLNQRVTSTSTPHVIEFQVRPAQCDRTSRVCAILLLSALPAITQPMILDGWSQGGAGYRGAPLIELNGASAGGIGSNGLTILTNNVTVRGFVINEFSGNGIQVGAFDRAQEVSGTRISGNYLGTDATGTVARGNQFAGVLVGNSSLSTIREDDTPGTGNVISGNGFGIVVNGGAPPEDARFLAISGNKIGTTADGSGALGNRREGIAVSNGFIAAIGPGGLAPGATRNIIAYNGSHGISMISGANVEIGDNEFFGNAGLGIDLGADGVTPNDPLDLDTGPNGLQNAPVMLAARQASNATVIVGVLNSRPGHLYRVRFFLAPGCTGGSPAQGRRLLAEQTVNTNPNGAAEFTVRVPTSLPIGEGLVATATDETNLGAVNFPEEPSGGSTSEFSLCQTVSEPGLIVGQTGPLETSEDGGAVNIPFSLAGSPTANVTLPLSSTNTREGTVSPATLTFTPENWNVPQTVTVRGVDDGVADGDVAYTVVIGPMSSTDVVYDGFDPTNLPAINHDNDGTPTLSVADVSMAEGNAVTSTMLFTVTLAPASAQTVRVSFSTAVGTANRNDFTENFGTLTFAPGDTVKTFTVRILGDTAVEPDEDLFVNLFTPENAVIGRAQARGVVVNDDVAPVTTCSPRPNPKIQTAQIGPGRLQVTVTAQSSATISANALQRLDFDAGDNARVEIPGAAAGSPGGPSASGGPPGTATAFSLPLTGNPTTQIFIVQRQQPGAFKLSFAVTDGCSGSAGPFRTFVGGGAGVP